MAPKKVSVDVEGRTLALSNLEKVLYPETQTTKSEIIHYYSQVASVLLPHLADRPITRKRWPDGVDADSFFEKNAPRGTPDWVRTVELPSPGSTMDRETVIYIMADDLATLVWLANLAVLEIHVPQWTVNRRGVAANPNRLVVDLDPGEPATIIDCCQVALLLGELFDNVGLPSYPKTSGSKGMQMYVPLDGGSDDDAISAFARDVAQRLERRHPTLIVSRMERRARPGKVFIDWSQNNSAKTTVAPYSLRGRPIPSVSMPVTWDEVDKAARSRARKQLPLQFDIHDALERIANDGDLLAPLLTEACALPTTM
jgi:bifunctional non-homologous end joining protein LigD